MVRFNPDEWKALKDLIEITIEEKFDEKFSLVAMKEDIKHLPTKEEFYAKMDEVLKEVKSGRNDRVESLEVLVQKN